MSVELLPKNDECYQFGVANGTWFALCNGPLKDFLGEQHTNDEMDIDGITAGLCADRLDLWEPPEGWFSPGREREGKKMFQEFFRECDGFTTY